MRGLQITRLTERGHDLLNDKAIIELFFKRSEEALIQLKSKYEKASLHIAKNILHSDEDAKECVNDAFLALWNAIPPQNPVHLSAYLCAVTRNIALKRYRQRGTDPATTPHEELSDILPANESIDDALSAKELRYLLEEWLGRQSKTDLYIFMRKYWYFDKVSNIAKALHMPERTVYHRLNVLKKDLYDDLLNHQAITTNQRRPK